MGEAKIRDAEKGVIPCVPRQEMVKWVYLDNVLRVKSNFQHKNNYPDLYHSQGV